MWYYIFKILKRRLVMRKALFVSLIMLLLFAFYGCAQQERRPPPPSPPPPTAPPPKVAPAEQIENRIRNLQQRIDDGVRVGDLTLPEARILQQRLDNIKMDFDRAMPGRLDPYEVEVLNRRLDALDRDVFGQKHDPQRRW